MSHPVREVTSDIEIWRGLGWILYKRHSKLLNVMGTHVDCAEDSDAFEPEWTGQSFFLEDMVVNEEDGTMVDGICYGCGKPVPPEVQALMVLFEGA